MENSSFHNELLGKFIPNRKHTHPTAQMVRHRLPWLRFQTSRRLATLAAALLADWRLLGRRLVATGLCPDDARRRKAAGHAINACGGATNNARVARLDVPLGGHCPFGGSFGFEIRDIWIELEAIHARNLC